MKVILLQDVARIGKRFEIKEVPDGHALNMLIPKGMAEAATPESIKRVKARALKAEAEQATHDAAFAEVLGAADGTTVTVMVEANEQGHMFEALKAEAIVEALQASGVTIPAEQVMIESPIKEVGEHAVSIQSGDQSGTITVAVTAK